MVKVFVIPAVITFVIYVFTIFLIFKRKRFTPLSIRSPLLLITNNISGCLCAIITMIELTDNDDRNQVINFISSLYWLFQFLLVLSIILRCQRISTCIKMNSSILQDERDSGDKKKLKEKYFFRILAISSVIFLIILIILFIIFPKHPFTMNQFYLNNGKRENYKLSRSNFYIIFTGIENLVLMYYAYKIFTFDVQEKLKFEILATEICLFVYSFILGLDNSDYIRLKKVFFVVISLIIFYICLILNGIFPVVLTYIKGLDVSYVFNPQLMNDLFLFLSNEQCYGAFYEYLGNNERNKFYLKVYTNIMSFRMEFMNEEEDNDKVELANNIKRELQSQINTVEEDLHSIIAEINETYKEINESNCTAEMFDNVLKNVFIRLTDLFNGFKKETVYQRVGEALRIDAHIYSKMCNSGLVNKY